MNINNTDNNNIINNNNMKKIEKKKNDRKAKIQQYGQPSEKECAKCKCKQTIENSGVYIIKTKNSQNLHYISQCDKCRNESRPHVDKSLSEEKSLSEFKNIPETEISPSNCNMCFTPCSPINTKVCKDMTGKYFYHSRCNTCNDSFNASNLPDTQSSFQSRKRKHQPDQIESKVEKRQKLVHDFGAPDDKKCSQCDIPLTITNAQIAKVKVSRKPDEFGVDKYKVYYNGMCDICRSKKEKNRRTTFDSARYALVKKREALCKKNGPPPISKCEKCQEVATPQNTAIVHLPNTYKYSNCCDNCRPPQNDYSKDTCTVEEMKNFLVKSVKQSKQRVYNTFSCDSMKDAGKYVTVTVDDLANIAKAQDYKCKYCAIDLHFFHTKTRNQLASLDRIDSNNRRYEVGNVYWSCFGCNVRKGQKTVEEFLEFLKMEKETEERIAKKNQAKSRTDQLIQDMYTHLKQ